MSSTTVAEMKEFVWEALRREGTAEHKRRQREARPRRVHRALVASRQHDEASLEHAAEHVAKEKGVQIGHGVIRDAVWDVYFEAFHLGLITAAFNGSQSWPAPAWAYEFAFTDRGLQFFSGEVPLWDSTHLSEHLLELRSRGSKLSDAQITLLLEAQRCWKAGCHRAAAVMLGLACEEGAERLLETIEQCLPEAPGSSLSAKWKIVRNPRDPIAKRWAAAMNLLVAERLALQGTFQKGSEPAWWESIWREQIEALDMAVGTVRSQRNDAAHDPKRLFAGGEIAVLVPSVPVVIDRLAKLHEFLRSPPAGLLLPAV